MKHLSIIFCAAALAVAFAVPASAENIVFRQIVNTDPNAHAYFSGNGSNDPVDNQTIYDNFSLANDTTLGSVQWDGEFLRSASAISSFTLTVYADNGDTPGMELYQGQISGNANQLFNGAALDNPRYDYETYSAPISVNGTANTQYWLSIVANTPQVGDWGWRQSVAGDNSAYATGPEIGAQQLGNDEAFTLFDDAVTPPPPTTAATPEPSSLMLLGTGVLGVAGTVRRRFASK